MSWKQKLEQRVLHNPVLCRQLATHFTGGRLGLVFFLLCGCLTLMQGILFVVAAESSAADRVEEIHGAGYFFHFVIILGFQIIFLPLKVSGLIEGLRGSRSFDQVVVTGVSPLLFYLGSWLVGNLYQALLLLISLPFAVSLSLFLQLDFFQLLGGYLDLFLYGNVIVALTLALSIPLREWISIPLTIALLAFWALFGVIIDREWVQFWRPQLAELSPVRLLSRSGDPFALEFGPYYQRLKPLLRDDPFLFGLEIPLAVYPYLAWAVLCGICFLVVIVGPKHDFSTGLDVFGAVTLPGDRKKRSFRKLRWGLVRRVELAFFFQNRFTGIERWKDLIRAGLEVLPVIFLWGVIIGGFFDGAPSATRRDFFDDGMICGPIILLALTTGIWILMQGDGSARVYRKEIWGPLRLEREFALLVQLLLLLGVFLWLGCDLLGQVTSTPTSQSFQYYRDGTNFLLALALFALNLFLFSRILSRWTYGAWFPRVNTILAVPLSMILAGLGFALHEHGVLRLPGAVLAGFSPLVLVDDFSRSWSVSQRILVYFSVQGSLFLLLLSTWILLRLSKKRTRRKLPSRGTVPGAVTATLLVLSFGGGSTPVRAQEGDGELPVAEPTPLVIERASRGFGGKLFTEQRDFYRARVYNPTDRTIRGEWFPRFPGVEELPRSFEIGPQTRRHFHLEVERRPDTRDFRFQDAARLVFRVDGAETVSDFLEIRYQVSEARSVDEMSRTHVLFIGKESQQPLQWREVALGGDRHRSAHAEVFTLPTDPLCYGGLDVIFVGALEENSDGWSPAQARALLRYLRLGGTVVLTASPEATGLDRVPAWQELLGGLEVDVAELDRRELRIGRFPRGWQTLPVETPGGEEIPLLTFYPVGAGRLGHLAFPLEAEAVPASLDILEFYERLNRKLRRGQSIPFTPRAQAFIFGRPTDYTLLLVVTGGLVLYTLAIGLIPMIFLRRREARSKLWPCLLGIPLASLAMLPLLDTVVSQRKSVASFHRVHLFGPGSTEGLTAAELHTVSSGRQVHEVEISGEDPDLHSGDLNWAWRFSSGRELLPGTAPPLGEPEQDGGPFPVRIEQAPWSRKRWTLVDRSSVPSPLEARARPVSGKNSLEIQLETPAWMRGGRLALVLIGGNQLFFLVNELESPETYREGLRMETFFQSEALEHLDRQFRTRRQRGRSAWHGTLRQAISVFGHSLSLPLDLPLEVRLFLAWEPSPEEDLELERLDVHSEDLIFEMNLDGYRAARARGAGIRSLVSTDGEHRLGLRDELYLLEIPVEGLPEASRASGDQK